MNIIHILRKGLFVVDNTKSWSFNKSIWQVVAKFSLRTQFRSMGSVVSRRSIASDIKKKNVQDEEIEFNEEICMVSEIPAESAKVFDVNGNKILVVKSEGSIYAVGSKCTHYGLPLEKASVCKGMIRCPFHGACFNLQTGDIEDFPGLDSLPKFKVEINDGRVSVSGSKALLESKKRRKTLAARESGDVQTFAIVGGGAAGAKCVETLRQEGFTGRILLFNSEASLPYDRPKLSKALHMTATDLALRDFSFYEEASIELQLGESVQTIDCESRKLTTSIGSSYSFDKLFIATGGTPRRLNVPGEDLSGVFVLRSFSDANSIIKEVKGRNVVVVGTSFIGMEAAAYLSSDNRCASVTVVGTSAVPFERSLGATIGGRIQKMFEEKGVAIINSARVSRLQGVTSVEKVILNDGREIDAGAVIVGVGVVPTTDFLRGTGLLLDENGYVCVDEYMKTSVDGIYCGGDIAAFPLFFNPGKLISIGHWQMAHKHGHVAALNMVGENTVPIRSVPFFWTVLFGKSLRYAGYGVFDDVVIAGDLESLTFVAYFCHGEKIVSVASIGRDPAAAKFADYLRSGAFLTREEVMNDPEVVFNLNTNS